MKSRILFQYNPSALGERERELAAGELAELCHHSEHDSHRSEQHHQHTECPQNCLYMKRKRDTVFRAYFHMLCTGCHCQNNEPNLCSCHPQPPCSSRTCWMQESVQELESVSWFHCNVGDNYIFQHHRQPTVESLRSTHQEDSPPWYHLPTSGTHNACHRCQCQSVQQDGCRCPRWQLCGSDKYLAGAEGGHRSA